ncbi:MAG: DUF2262 domain-containing protein [Spirochaetia bacterium]|nr:DUF2262 domain-containing protein [Spirochaetia bacterium]
MKQYKKNEFMKYNYNREERLFMRPESIQLLGKNIHVSIDTSYKESEYEDKLQKIIERIESNKNLIDDALLENIYEIYYDTWMYDKERNVTKDEFFNNLILESIILTKNDSCTMQYQTGELFDGKDMEVIYDADGSIFIAGLDPKDLG